MLYLKIHSLAICRKSTPILSCSIESRAGDTDSMLRCRNDEAKGDERKRGRRAIRRVKGMGE